MNTTSFFFFLQKTLDELDLQEVSDLFPKHQINNLFLKAIDDLLPQIHEDETRHELLEFRSMDQVSYIEGALRRAGFRDPDIDPLVHDLVVKLLITGNLFTGWKGQSLIGRFKVAVTNAIRTLITRRSRHRKRSHELRDDHPARAQQPDDLTREFREWLRVRYGNLAVRVFDHRMDGGDTVALIGEPGLETSYKVKQAVHSIKTAAEEYSNRDPAFFRMVQRAFADERALFSRRFPSRV